MASQFTKFITVAFTELVFIALLLVPLSTSVSDVFYTKTSKNNAKSPWQHGLYSTKRDRVRNFAHNLRPSSETGPVLVPLEVSVVLVGFGPEASHGFQIDSHSFSEFLHQSFPSHRPVFKETGEEIVIQHEFSYFVMQVDGKDHEGLEGSLKAAMAPIHVKTNRVYKVEATKFEPALDDLYSSLFGSGDMESLASPAAVFVLQLDKERLDPEWSAGSESTNGSHGNITRGGFNYLYQYSDSLALTQAWVGHGRYAVIDMSAGPCSSQRAFPCVSNVAVRAVKGTGGPMVEGQVAALVISAIRHFVSPDLLYQSTNHAQRVLLSVIVLRNHHLYNILSHNSSTHLSLNEVEIQLSRLIQPRQNLLTLSGSHSLHDHERVSMAVTSAIQSRSLKETAVRVDGEMLIEEFSHSSDALVAGMLEPSTPLRAPSFFDATQGLEETDEEESRIVKKRKRGNTWLPVKHDWQPRETLAQRNFRRTMAKLKANVSLSKGTRVLPIFILCLNGFGSELTMADGSYLEVSKDLVLLLHTNASSSESLNQRVVAGAASALGALGWSDHVGRGSMADNLWSVGHHPFGSFSSCPSVSHLLQDSIQRNGIYSQVDNTVRSIRGSLSMVEEFVSQYLVTPLGRNVSFSSKSIVGDLIDRMHDEKSKPVYPISHHTIDFLERSIKEMEDEMVMLSEHLFNHNFDLAHDVSMSLMLLAHKFQRYTEHRLERSKEEMKCCSLVHRELSTPNWSYLYVGILLSGVLVYSLVIFISRSDHR